MPIDRCAFRPVPAALALAFYAAGAAANPQGGVVKAGSATIAPNGSRLEVIQSSQRAVIDWRSFSIGAGRSVAFKQPSAASATLNRVTGPEMSAILGQLTANGTVFLVNPNGILIGPGARIDVGGLVAATANISNENFMAGRYKFDEVVNRNAVIVNRGEITAHAGGLVALVAPGVENSGVIRAELGRVVLASGNRFTLDLFGDKLVTFAVDDKVAARLTDVDGRPLQAYVNQAGRIEADGGSILIAASAAKAVLDNVINTSGVVRATSFVQRTGEIVLHGGEEGVVRVAGALDASGRASGASGGSVKVLGAEVVLDAGSRIDVAGDAGGGSALVGGGVQGGGGVPRSMRTVIEGGAAVNADALTLGNGGTIVAWSDGETRFAGALSARGGARGGDGGFVEVSGKRELSFNGTVDVGAPAGKGGRLLLDPESLVVDAATAASIAAALRSGADEVRTVAETIDVREPIDGRFGAPGGGFKLEAGYAITVRNDILTNDGPVSLRAGAGGIAMNAGPATSVTKGNGTLIYAGAAPITLTATGDIDAQHLVTTGAVTMTSSARAVTAHRDLGGSLGDGIGSLAASAAQGVRLKGVKTTGGVTVATLDPGGTIALEGPIAARGNVIVGTPALAADTVIWLHSDVHTQNNDIEFNGRTWISPIVRPDNVLINGLPLFSTVDQALFDIVVVQVSLQTTGDGSVRMNGDVLWDGLRPVELPYLYNTRLPSPGFNWLDPGAVAGLRSAQPLRPVRYFGLNIGVERGTVILAGNVGTIDATGGSTKTPAPEGSLGQSNSGNGLLLNVTTLGGPDFIWFGGTSRVEVPSFRIVRASDPSFFMDVLGPDPFLAPPLSYTLLPGGNLPQVSVDGGNPNLVMPSPRNVAAATRLERTLALPEVPIQPSTATTLATPSPATAVVPAAGTSQPPSLTPAPAASSASSTGSLPLGVDSGVALQARESAARGATSPGPANEAPAVLHEPARGADLGREGVARGAARDVFEPGTSVVQLGTAARAADAEYFSQGPFEYLETLSRRAE